MTERKERDLKLAESIPKEAARKYLLEAFGVEQFEEVQGGHKGAYLLLGKGAKKQQIFFKLGVTEQSAQEVNDNIYGYEQLQRLGAGTLLPLPISVIRRPEFNGLAMKFLGQPVNSALLQGDSATWQGVIESWLPLFADAKAAVPPRAQSVVADGLASTVVKLQTYLQRLTTANFIDQGALSLLEEVDISRISENQQVGLQILDFTPDNVFVCDGQLKFIDPWKQKSYLGSPVPGLSQFLTLSRNVYQYPLEGSDWQLGEEVIDQVSRKLRLSPQQTAWQKALGSALQYSLSAAVRISSNPQRAQLLAEDCIAQILQLPLKGVPA